MFINNIIELIYIIMHINFCLSFSVARPDVIKEVVYGKTAILQCPGDDQDHNFMFWQLPDANRSIIGPGNEYNKKKYEYEVLTGKLIIKNVSSEDEGILNCVTKGVRNDDINIRSLRMVVKKDWEDVYENNSYINTLRVFIVLGSLIIIIGGGFLIYNSWKGRNERQLFLGEDEEDESNDELFPKPGPSSQLHSRSSTPSPSPFRHSMDFANFKSVDSGANLINYGGRNNPDNSTAIATTSYDNDDNGNESKQLIPSVDVDKQKQRDLNSFDPFGDNGPNFN